MASGRGTDVVTGAFGYAGKYITRRLLGLGRQVVTLTGHPNRPSPFDDAVTAMPYHLTLTPSGYSVIMIHRTS